MTLFTDALVCAALLMNTPVPSGEILYQDRDVPRGAAQCRDGKCLAITTNTPDLWIIVGRAKNIKWPQAVHEACHRVQFSEGQPYNERECYAVQSEARTCQQFAP